MASPPQSLDGAHDAERANLAKLRRQKKRAKQREKRRKQPDLQPDKPAAAKKRKRTHKLRPEAAGEVSPKRAKVREEDGRGLGGGLS
eukprot:scaffold7967_cov382-Pinguiococcus_pyrenoidosus.AAC.3